MGAYFEVRVKPVICLLSFALTLAQGTRRLHSLYDKGLYVHLYIGSKCSNFIKMFIMHVHTVESHYLGRPGYG